MCQKKTTLLELSIVLLSPHSYLPMMMPMAQKFHCYLRRLTMSRRKAKRPQKKATQIQNHSFPCSMQLPVPLSSLLMLGDIEDVGPILSPLHQSSAKTRNLLIAHLHLPRLPRQMPSRSSYYPRHRRILKKTTRRRHFGPMALRLLPWL